MAGFVLIMRSGPAIIQREYEDENVAKQVGEDFLKATWRLNSGIEPHRQVERLNDGYKIVPDPTI